jgi:hypothetical protein
MPRPCAIVDLNTNRTIAETSCVSWVGDDGGVVKYEIVGDLPERLANGDLLAVTCGGFRSEVMHIMHLRDETQKATRPFLYLKPPHPKYPHPST